MVFRGLHDAKDKNLIAGESSPTADHPTNLLMSLCNSSEIPVEASQAPRDIGPIPNHASNLVVW
jgi:hypothetical protein